MPNLHVLLCVYCAYYVCTEWILNYISRLRNHIATHTEHSVSKIHSLTLAKSEKQLKRTKWMCGLIATHTYSKLQKLRRKSLNTAVPHSTWFSLFLTCVLKTSEKFHLHFRFFSCFFFISFEFFRPIFFWKNTFRISLYFRTE